MNDSELQSILGTTQTDSQSQTGSQVDAMLGTLQPLLQWLLIVSIILTIVITVIFIANAIHRWRVSKAILRIDKNVQLLVAAQQPAAPPHPAITALTSPQDDIEQK